MIPLLPDSLFSPDSRRHPSDPPPATRPLHPPAIEAPRPPPSSTLRPKPILPPLPRRSGSVALISEFILSRSKTLHRAAHPRPPPCSPSLPPFHVDPSRCAELLPLRTKPP
ncbi:hypothetical protein BRADI_4g03571v3 [Brachypodium distachyon]|uniref:Uncharacterized protein n=1 Tax=Brachypodium distachyon TaxID=15368 RepID=A0A0Q3L1B1_BRADI|nr:hypothetical protein BRADI_4g03571v3 [Brachypodium distachyon]